MSMPDAVTEPVVVIGAGPVGLAAALLLASENRPVAVYESHATLALSDANSYPIGVNLRGQEALRRIDPALLERLRADAQVVAAFRIHAGRRQVAELPSGTLLATTRAHLTALLLEAAETNPHITLTTGRRLTRVDVAGKRLLFEDADGATHEVDASGARVVAADGVWSATRTSLAEQLPAFTPDVDPWGVQFRVLFSRPDAAAPGMDPACHYIFSDKGIYTSTLKNGVWCLALSLREGDDEAAFLGASEATPENVAALERYVTAHAAKAAPLFTDADHAAFFGRGSFTGAVVRCPVVHVDEWLVLLGDAAHGVIPPTGEGVNSGLEDCCLLAEQMASGSTTPFTDYSTQRMPDLAALGEYAHHLMENVRDPDPARRFAGVAFRIAGALGKLVGSDVLQVEGKLFGPQAGRTPYREILGPWLRRRDALFPVLVRVGRVLTRRRRAA